MEKVRKKGATGRNLTEGNVFKHMVLFSLPLLIGNVLQSLNQIIDAFWVGRFVGSDALAAVAVSGPVVFVLLAFVFGFVIAAPYLVSAELIEISHSRENTAQYLHPEKDITKLQVLVNSAQQIRHLFYF